MNQKYLITGGSGTLGRELCSFFDQFGMLYYAPTRDNLDITWSAQEMSEELWSQGIKQNDVISIIHCAAYTDVPGAETNKKEALENNIVGTKNIKELGYMFGTRVVYISTDYVYDGIGGCFKEDDPRIAPFNFYGFTKLAGESYMDENDLIIRTSFKPNEKWAYPKAFDDLWTSADYVDIIAPKIADLVVNNATGIYNVGTERKTIYDLARRRTTKVKPMSRKDVASVRLPEDISMLLDKYEKYYDLQYGDY